LSTLGTNIITIIDIPLFRYVLVSTFSTFTLFMPVVN